MALSKANPPQIHWTRIVSVYRMAENGFVFYSGPQNDICPRGKTYPKKVVAATIIRMMTPTDHAWR